MSIPQDLWGTDELALHILGFLPPPDLRNCAQVSRSFNRIAVQSVLDQHGIWNAQQSATLQLADNPNDLDGLSALLLSVHVKSLRYVIFNLKSVTSLHSALRSFYKMQRLVDRMTSLHTVYVHWPSEAYAEQPISDKMLANACKSVEAVLDTIVAKGCTQLQLGGCNAFASKYKLKKNPAITTVETPRALATEKSSIWGSARGYLASRHTRAASEVSPSPSEESNYCRKSHRFSISAPWISLTPSPKLSQVTKLATFCAYSTSVFRPPFSQWTFTLLKASPITFVTLCLQDLPNEALESKLILDRLAEAVPDVTTIHLDGVRPGLLKDVVTWLGRFKELRDLRMEPERWSAGTDLDDRSLQALSRLPHLRTLASSSSILCSLLASCRSIGAGINASNLVMRYMWTSSTRSAVTAFIKDVERFHNAILKTVSSSEVQDSNIRIKLRFDSFCHRAKELEGIWGHQDQLDGGEDKVSQVQQRFYPSNSGPWYGFCLELHLPVTVDEIQQGAVDKEVIAFCRILPSLSKLWLWSFGAVSLDRGMPLAQERLDKFRTVCRNLDYGWVC